MRSYEWKSPEAVQAAINALPERYPMTLTADSMEALIRSLVWAVESYMACAGERGNPLDHDEEGECLDTCWRARAQALAGDIAYSVGCDWI